MPTITVDRKEFERLVGKKLSLEKLKERISYLGTDLDSVGDEITVEIFPNRPDMLSVQGFARAFSSFIGARKGLRKYTVHESGEKVIVDSSVAGVRPYTACAIVRGIRYTDRRIREVIQIQEKLHVTYGRNRRKVAIGIYPFEKIRPPIRFLAKKPRDIAFRPLESASVMGAAEILAGHPAGKEYGHLLDGCGMYPMFIDADGNVLSMPPIVNSHLTGKITQKTRDVFIECSGFDFGVLKVCLNIIVAALADMGGKIYSMDLAYGKKVCRTPDMAPWKMKADRAFISRLLGVGLTERQLSGCLSRMGYSYSRPNVLVPAYRADVLHQVDLAEDVAIAYGYENFRPAIPNVATTGDEDSFERFKSKVADILVGLGLIEVNTYNLTSKEIQCTRMNCSIELVELANSLSSEYNVLRAWVLPSLLEVLGNNRHHDYPHRIFSIGTVFKKNRREETGIQEDDRVAVAVCSDSTNFTEIRQIFDYLMSQISLQADIKETDHPSFIAGRVARGMCRGRKAAYLGEISPKVLQEFGIEMPLSVLELNLSEIFKCWTN